MDEDIDPTQFLARDDDDYSRDEDEPISLTGSNNAGDGEGGPPILTSLGLTHINAINPYSGMVSQIGLPVNYFSHSLLCVLKIKSPSLLVTFYPVSLSREIEIFLSDLEEEGGRVGQITLRVA